MKVHLSMEKWTVKEFLSGMMGKFMKVNFIGENFTVEEKYFTQMDKWPREYGNKGKTTN